MHHNAIPELMFVCRFLGLFVVVFFFSREGRGIMRGYFVFPKLVGFNKNSLRQLTYNLWAFIWDGLYSEFNRTLLHLKDGYM